MLPLQPPHPTEVRRVERQIWQACAGSSVQIPTLGSRVYYFPQGHIEQNSFPLPPPFHLPSSIPNIAPSTPPLILCQISAVHFLADPITDEVYAKLLLLPLNHHQYSFSDSPPLFLLKENIVLTNHEDFEEESDKVVTFAKVLTPSDANNGGGFSVPRFCADSIFPPLSYQVEPPVQTLTVTDVHGITWKFRHIYRGTPRRHLLTTKWSTFVNDKNLVAGDSVVFMRNSRGEVFIGLRRGLRFSGNGGGGGGGDYDKWWEQIGGRVKVEGFGTSGRERLSPEAVGEAVERAVQGLPFEVVYYPKAGWYSDFVVKAEVVEAALNVYWRAGMRVKLAMETEDSSRMTWFQGTVAAAVVPDVGPWRGSPWRMLQITWDEPEVLQNAKRVNPWQVEFLAPAPPLDAAFPHSKKFKFPETSRLLTDGEGDIFLPTSRLTNSTVSCMSSSLLNYNTFPASIQGTRQDLFSALGTSKFLNAPQMSYCNAFGHNVVPKSISVSTELNIGSLRSDNLSPDSQSGVHCFGMELVDKQGSNSSKVGTSSFQLFGQIIHINQPVEGGLKNVVCVQQNSDCKGCNVEEGVHIPLSLSTTSSCTELLIRTDVPSAAEAYVAMPKQIRELMKVDGLTNDEVKSQLQGTVKWIAR